MQLHAQLDAGLAREYTRASLRHMTARVAVYSGPAADWCMLRATDVVVMQGKSVCRDLSIQSGCVYWLQ
jgi:hypothetical protein